MKKATRRRRIKGRRVETAGESVVVDSDFESAKWAAEEKRRWQETTGSWGTFNMQQSSSLPLSLPTCVCVCSLSQGVCVFAKWKWKSSHGLVTKANKRAERASSYLFGNCSLLFIVVRVCGGCCCCCCFCYCCCLRLGIAQAPPTPAPPSTTTWTGHPNHSASYPFWMLPCLPKHTACSPKVNGTIFKRTPNSEQ